MNNNTVEKIIGFLWFVTIGLVCFLLGWLFRAVKGNRKEKK